MSVLDRTKSAKILNRNKQFIPGGIVSMARKADPDIVFARAKGAYLWDMDGNRYLDYHAAFGPHVLGFHDPAVTAAVRKVLDEEAGLYGAGTNALEGRLAELMCENLPGVDMVSILNTGTEASMTAVRLARAVTGKDDLIVMQGGFNGSHNDCGCNVLTPLSEIGPRVSPGEYRYVELGPGVPETHKQLVHIVNFNDLDSVRYVCERNDVACLITEPVLQNIGIVKPKPGYLQGLRDLADEFGFLLIYDEVKTGFRYCVGGYAEVSGVTPDLAYYAKAIANGYPLSALGGKREYMVHFAHENPTKRPMASGTYNGHPIPVAAAIATIERFLENDGEVYRHLERLGEKSQDGIETILRQRNVTGTVVRQGSAYSIYFMDHAPVDWHDLAGNHDFNRDLQMRRAMVDAGVYYFPVATKQCSISATHTDEDIDFTLEQLDRVLPGL